MKRMLAVTAALVAVAASTSVFSAPAAVQRPAAPQLLATVKVTASEFKFVLSKKTARRGVVVFKVTNVGALQHNFSIHGRTTKMLKHGQSDTLRVTFLRKGHYAYKCTVPGHAAAGMKGVFTIS